MIAPDDNEYPACLTPARRRMAVLIAYWLVQLVAAFVAFHYAEEINSQWQLEEGTVEHFLASCASAFIFGWFATLPLWPAAVLAISTDNWWRRPLVAVLLMLSLEYLVRFGSEEERPEYIRDGSMFLWLPFLAAAIVMSIVAALGRWRTIVITEKAPPARQQFSLRDMFIATAVFAGCIPIGHSIFLSLTREPKEMLDGLGKILAAIAAIFPTPFAAFTMISVVRMIVSQHRPSIAIMITGSLGWIAAIGFAVVLQFSKTEHDRRFALLLLCFAAGITAHAAFVGLLLRYLGYRVESRSWWK